MPKLHIVGVSDDNRGLILSERPRAKSGDLLLEINDALMDAIHEARRARLHTETNAIVSRALPTRRDPDAEGQASSRLSPREIQRRLRMGESVASVARRAGVDEAWVDRFAPPVVAEQARIVDKARAIAFAKPRVGVSSAPLGEAVVANVFDKGVRLTMAEAEDGWSAYQRRDDMWCIGFTYTSRGRKQSAEWDYYTDTNELVARNRLASELGFLDAKGRRKRRVLAEPEAESTPAKQSAAKRSTTTKRVAAARATKRPAKRAAKPAKKTARKTAARKPAARKTTARKPAARKPAARKTTARKTTARKTTARKPAARKTAARKPAARKTTARKTTARKTTARKTTARKTTARKPAARTTTARRATAVRKPAKKAAARRPVRRRSSGLDLDW
jgi:hypothetical protein